MNRCAATLAVTLSLAGCSVAPYRYPDVPARQDLVALLGERAVDPQCTYYESPHGLLILAVAGPGSLVRGGIYRRSDPSANHPLDVYGGVVREPLHDLGGLKLSEKLECTPACQLK